MHRLLLLAVLLIAALAGQVAAKEDAQTPLTPSAAQQKYPKIVLYSVSWCPHCREAKEYFTSHNIPFINKDVEADEEYMKELSSKYKSQAVPVIVIGDKVVLRGFNKEKFEKSLTEFKTGK